jgi:hypothetical protein
LAYVGGLTAAVVIFVLHVGVALSTPTGQDFAAFVANAEAWRDGTPYEDDRDANPPHVILLFVPFTALALEVGVAVWLAISAGAGWLCWRLIGRRAGVSPPGNLSLVLLALFVAAPATTEMVVNANMVWVLWLPFTAAWLLTRGGRAVAGGALLGVLVTTKPFLALWLPYFMLRRSWRALGGALAGAAVGVAFGVAVAGADAWVAWMGALQRIPWHAIPFNTSVAGVLARVSALETLTWLAASVPFLAVAGSRVLRQPHDIDREWTLLLLTALLVGPLGWRYYHCWAIGPLAAWLTRKPPGPVAAGMLLLTAFTPTFEAIGRSTLFAVSVGSTAFWTALAAWLVVAFAPQPDHRRTSD